MAKVGLTKKAVLLILCFQKIMTQIICKRSPWITRKAKRHRKTPCRLPTNHFVLLRKPFISLRFFDDAVDPDHGMIVRHITGYDRIGADLDMVADRYIPQYFRTGSTHDPI